ncbi:MAG: type II secretion system F family protein [Chloroflexi bacterium]|nr:type II secretion system F family protein [Chloroflexota bacterium]
MALGIFPDWLLPICAAGSIGLFVWGFYSLVAGSRVTVRERLSTSYATAGGTVAQTATRNGLPMKDRSLSSVELLDRYLQRSNYAQRVELDLARAALPIRVGEYLFIRWLIGAALFLLLILLKLPLLAALVVGLLGFVAPRFYVASKESQRIRKLEDQLVDALSMMANSLKAGSSFLQAMEMVANELPAPISEEFQQVVAEVGVGAPVDQALTEFSQRVRSYDLYLVVTAIIVQRHVGGNLAEVLSNIAHTIRERQQMLRQAQVETSEMRLSAYVLIALPIVMAVYLVTTRYTYIEPMFTTSTGRLLLVGAAIMQVIGYYIMRKIADVKV